MYKIYKKTALIIACLLLGLNSNAGYALNENDIGLRGKIGEEQSSIQLKGNISIDNEDQIINLSLRDSDVKQVLRMLADKAGLNLVIHGSVTGNVTLDLKNVTLNKAFEYIMQMNGLAYTLDHSTSTMIVAAKTASHQIGLNMNKIKPIQIKYLDAGTVAKFLNSNIFSLNRPDLSSSSGSNIAVTNPRTNQILIFGNEQDFDIAQNVISMVDTKPIMKTFDINYADASNLAKTLCFTVFNEREEKEDEEEGEDSDSDSSSENPADKGSESACGTITLLSSEGSAEGGESTDATAGGGEDGTGTPQPPTGNAGDGSTATDTAGSAEGSATGLESLEAPGYAVISNKVLGQITVIGTQDQIDLSADFIKKFDKRQPQAYIETSIIELNESGSKSLSNTLSFQKGNISSLGYTGGNNTFAFSSTGRYAKALQNTITALIEENKGRVLSNPRIVAANFVESKIDISNDIIESVTREFDTESKITTYTYNIGQAGIKLEIIPKITPNKDIVLSIKPSYTSEKEVGKDAITNLPNYTLLNNRKLEAANIRVKNGETLILGGLIQEIETKDIKKVPFVSDIPILGLLFKNTSTDRQRNELIIMITPRVLDEDNNIDTM